MGEGLCFDRSFLGVRTIGILQCLPHAYLKVLGHPLKNGL